MKTKNGSKTRKIAIHPKHAKKYRKRHLGLLVVCSVAVLVLLGMVVQYNTRLQISVNNAKDFVARTFTGQPNSKQAINSTYGYSLVYNPNTLYASGIDGNSGSLYVGSELATDRAYQIIHFSPAGSVKAGTTSQNSMTIEYGAAAGDPSKLAELENQLVAAKQRTASQTVTQVDTQDVKVGGQNFVLSTWKRQSTNPLTSKFSSQFTSYVGVIHGKSVVITVNVENNQTAQTMFEDVVKSIKFGVEQQSAMASSPTTVAKVESSRSMLDSALLTSLASAATPSTVNDSEKISALYGPATIKIYNVYCMDISVQGQPYIKDACDGVAGSGFFVSGDGYIATNGHVASSSPKDIVIQDAIEQLIKGEPKYFNALASLSHLDINTLKAAPDDDHLIDMAIDSFLTIPDSTFTKTNDVSNLLVTLNSKQPDVNILIAATKARGAFNEQDSIKHAKLVASNFSSVDGVTKFRYSDVAIIKITGSNYPVTTLGLLSDVSQGSGLSILGYPANASDNGLVNSDQSKVTLTTGKVSSIKNATASDKKLIETDTVIGHGNSGGPVFEDNGKVVGIATYTADGAGTGNGVFNYIRDIKDLQDLANTSSVKLGVASKTQTEWQTGINLFYKAHYSGALKNFAVVKKLYPQDSKVDEFIATSQQRIKNGEDVKDFPIVLVLVGAGVALAGAGVAAFMMIRHHGKHQLYKVASGQAVAAPSGFGDITGSVSIPQIPSGGTIAPTAPPAAPEAPAAPPAEPTPEQPAPPPAPEPIQPTEPPAGPPTPPVTKISIS